MVLSFFAPGLIALRWARAIFPSAPRGESAAAILGIEEPVTYSHRGERLTVGPWTVLFCAAFWTVVGLALAVVGLEIALWRLSR